MIKHYLKVSFRNLWKYKSQTLISVIGMAVGFACFAMSALWIRYEMTYDTSHKNADRLYRVSVKNMRGPGLTPRLECPLDVYLEKTFPEVKNAARMIPSMTETLEINGVEYEVREMQTFPSFLKMFDVKILSGNSDFMIPENRQIAITQEKSVQLFGDENPVGKALKPGSGYTIGAVVSGYSSSGYTSH
ncbi:MAG: ABC transporter permease, partial [Prevotellaceae bacterium]|nr:ABC transporter permease [Prevotellaceae bacterium]